MLAPFMDVARVRLVRRGASRAHAAI